MAIHFTIERSGRTFRARADGGPPFFVGHRASYVERASGRRFEGLFNTPSSLLPRLAYDPADIRGAQGFWADFIRPTVLCEGAGYLTLHSCDRARFSWGIGRFFARTPQGGLADLIRDLLGRPEARDYFPDLRVAGGRIVRTAGDADTPLESPTGARPLLAYLNPGTQAVEDAEVIAGAKLIHWATHVTAARDLQAQHMVGLFRRLMHEADRRLDLDGRAADLCCVICDIRFQGRADFAAMQAALAAADPLKELVRLGSIAFPERPRTLRRAIALAGAAFSGKAWDRAAGDFR